MIPIEIRHLAEALQKRWPRFVVGATAGEHDTTLVVTVAGTVDGVPKLWRFVSPATLDYKALSMEEWLARFHALMQDRLP